VRTSLKSAAVDDRAGSAIGVVGGDINLWSEGAGGRERPADMGAVVTGGSGGGGSGAHAFTSITGVNRNNGGGGSGSGGRAASILAGASSVGASASVPSPVVTKTGLSSVIDKISAAQDQERRDQLRKKLYPGEGKDSK
jgi:hypothetical protein